MAQRHPGLTSAIAQSNHEAARVCLDRHHKSPRTFTIEHAANTREVAVEWVLTDDKTRRAWANEIDTTEQGAYACALAAVELVEGLVAIHRAETKSGADYYLAPLNVDVSDLESAYRIEVSGTDRGDSTEIRRRMTLKIAQARKGASNLPAIASVVGFRATIIEVSRVIAT